MHENRCCCLAVYSIIIITLSLSVFRQSLKTRSASKPAILPKIHGGLAPGLRLQDVDNYEDLPVFKAAFRTLVASAVPRAARTILVLEVNRYLPDSFEKHSWRKLNKVNARELAVPQLLLLQLWLSSFQQSKSN